MNKNHFPLTVFVCAPYRGQGETPYADCSRNIEKARQTAINIAAMNIYPITPHLNTAHFDYAVPRQFPDVFYTEELYLNGCLKLLSHSDALFMDADATTEGMKGELAFANENGIPIIRSLKALRLWKEEMCEGKAHE